MGTIHNRAEKGDIARTVLMPGDPNRARFIAENFLEDARLVNDVRCAFCYTGTYHARPVSVMASGMGAGSMGIYSYELYTYYDVESVIRVGSAGAIVPDLDLGEIVLATAASSDSGYADRLALGAAFAPAGDFSLMRRAADYMDANNICYRAGTVFSGAAFHYPDHYFDKWAGMGVLAVEMEAAALYTNAAQTGKRALAMVTISDQLIDGRKLSPKERETTFSSMIKTALSLV